MAGFKVLIPQDIREEGKAYLRDRGYEIKMSGPSVEEMKRDVVDCHAILARMAPLSAEVLEAGKELRVIGRHGVGVDNVDMGAAARLGITVTNTPESNAGTVAEYAFGMIIALARHFVAGDKATRSGDFSFRNHRPGSDLEGKTLGVLGMGRIGRQVAKKARFGLDMKVIGYDPFVDPAGFPEYVDKIAEKAALFRNADFVSVHIPSTSDTRNSIGEREFALMKNTAYFINAARGDLVDEEALVRALAGGGIAGAGLDVYTREPPPADHPLFALDNVILSPHNASLTTECMSRMALHAAEGIDDVLSGRTPRWPVNALE